MEPAHKFAQVVWASHILSYLNPYTSTTSDEPSQPDDAPAAVDAQDEDDEDMADADIASLDAEILTPQDDKVREKFLDCVSELLSHTKGGKFVTAAALREKEDSIEIDLVRNDGFDENDRVFLSSLTKFLTQQGNEDRTDPDVAEHCHSFLQDTIDYSTSRLDFCLQEAGKVLKGASFRPLDSLPRTSPGQGSNCLLDFCQETHSPGPKAVEPLILDLMNFHVGQSPTLSRAEKITRRRQCVEYAAACVYSPEDTLQDLNTLIPCADPFLILKKWKLLARPVTNLRTLGSISRLLPNFRSVKFITISLPAPLQLARRQVPTIWKAWKQLDLTEALGSDIPCTLTQKNIRFRKECSRTLPSHCEVQLLMRYEAEPSLTPTLAYFGCSKKACFLCAAFLTISPLKPRVRGRHGMCHPLWGVQPSSWKAMGPRLSELCEVLKQQIRALLSPEPHPPAAHIKQSSARSGLNSDDVVELRRQRANRDKLDGENREFRQKMQILLYPRSVGPQIIWYRDLGALCVMCQSSGANRCTRCYATQYCSKRCQEIDWPAHKLFCSRYLGFLNSRPSDAHRLGIWFPRDTERPKLVWASPTPTDEDYFFPNFDPFLGSHHGVYYTLPFLTNKRRGLQLNHWLTIYYRDYDEVASKSIYRCVEACHGMTLPGGMPGDYVVLSCRPACSASEVGDMTLAGFRHVLDFLSTYWDRSIRETPTGGSISAVKISCRLEELLFGCDTFSMVALDREFPCDSGISPISVVLGDPLIVCLTERGNLEREMEQLDSPPENAWRNQFAQMLMMDLDPASDKFGKVSDTRKYEGTVIVLREDRTDIDVEWVQHLCEYCLQVLKPLIGRSLAGEISAQDVLKEIALERVAAWGQMEAPRQVGCEQRAGFVAPIGSHLWQQAKESNNVLRVVEETLKDL